MEQFFNAWMQAQRGGNRGTSAKDMLRWLGFLSLIASGCFWYPVQWELASPTKPTEYAIAISFGTFLVLGPPVFTAFIIPWSPGARLLQRINAKLPGQMVVLACALYLTYYAEQLLWAWWQSRPLVAEAGLAMQQTIVGIIATIIAPALLWAPVSSEEMAETLKQDQLVQKYRLQAQADIAYLQAIVLDAQRAAAHGLAATAATHGAPETAWRMQWLAETIDQTIGEISHTVKEIGGTRVYFPNLLGQAEVIEALDYVAHLHQHTVDNPSPVPRAAPRVIAPVAHQDAERAVSREDMIEGQVPSRAGDRDTARDLPQPPAASGNHRQPQVRELAAAPATPDPAATAVMVAYAVARRLLSGAWMREDVERVLGIKQTKAGDFLRGWKAAGLVAELTEPKWHYCWTDDGEVRA